MVIEDYKHTIELIATVIALIAVVIILVAVVYSTSRYIYLIIKHRGPRQEDYDSYRRILARALILGLEILVAADIVETVALDSSLESVATLGLLVLVRTFLSWSLEVEAEGRWPWQPKRRDLKPD